MIKSIEVAGFRKFKNMKIDDLSQINVFLGDNNAGKTTILESVFGAACGENISSLLENCVLRRSNINGTYDFVERIIGAFTDKDKGVFECSFKVTDEKGQSSYISHIIRPTNIFADIKPNLQMNFSQKTISGMVNTQIIQNGIVNIIANSYVGEWEVSLNGGIKKNAVLTFPNKDVSLNGQPLMAARFIDILSHRNQQENTIIYSYLKREGILNEFIKELSSTFGDITDIDSIPYPDGSSSPVSVRINKEELIPLYNFGDGFQRWYNILGGMVYYKNSIHCIEEIDVTFHTSAQRQLAQNLMYYSEKFNNQIFMTSHSIEFVDNFLQGLDSDKLNSVRIITLKEDPVTKETKARVLSGVEALDIREEYNMELR